MKRALAMAMGAWLPLATFAQAPTDAGNQAARLVELARFADIAEMGLHKSIDVMKQQGMSENQAACVRSVDGSRFAPMLARVAASELTPAEIDEAIRFYDSEAGRKYTEMTLAQSAKMVGAHSSHQIPDFSAEEVKATEDFGKTQVFQKLVNQNILTRSPMGRNEYQALTMQILKGCGVGRQG
jgi:hypothetical protein